MYFWWFLQQTLILEFVKFKVLIWFCHQNDSTATTTTTKNRWQTHVGIPLLTLVNQSLLAWICHDLITAVFTTTATATTNKSIYLNFSSHVYLPLKGLSHSCAFDQHIYNYLNIYLHYNKDQFYERQWKSRVNFTNPVNPFFKNCKCARVWWQSCQSVSPAKLFCTLLVNTTRIVPNFFYTINCTPYAKKQDKSTGCKSCS